MSKIVERIKKLFRQSKSEGELGNEAASQKFAEAAASLLIKHKLELADIDNYKEAESNPLTYETVTPREWGEEHLPNRVEWIEDLAKVIAENYFCRLLVFLDNNSLILVGRKSDIDIARYVFCLVMRTGLAACEVELASILLGETAGGIKNNLWENGFNDEFRFSFFSGYNGRIAQRLHFLRERAELEAGACQALMRVEQEVEDYLQNELKPGQEERFCARQVALGEAYVRGAIKGEGVALTANALSQEERKLIDN